MLCVLHIVEGGNKLRVSFLFPHATFVCVVCFVFLSNQRNNNKTQTKTHVHIQIAKLVQLYNVLYFHSRVGRAGVSKILTKNLSHPTHGVSHLVFCKPIPELKMPDRR